MTYKISMHVGKNERRVNLNQNKVKSRQEVRRYNRDILGRFKHLETRFPIVENKLFEIQTLPVHFNLVIEISFMPPCIAL